jgi:hypothetical protein
MWQYMIVDNPTSVPLYDPSFTFLQSSEFIFLARQSPFEELQDSAHYRGHSPLGKCWFKFICSAHMNTMELIFLAGLQKMCMFHEPEGFGPILFT